MLLTLTPGSASAAVAGGSELLHEAPAGCTWTATSSASWLTVTGGASGSGNRTISYSASSTTAARAGVPSPQAGSSSASPSPGRAITPWAVVHLHPGSAAIATLDVPPATVAGEADERPRANLHDPDCVTVKIFPPAVIDALRVAPPLFELVE